MMRGFGKIIGGPLFEFPKTIIEATLEGPMVAGTLVGVVAGAARGVQTMFAGAGEVAAAFDPWGTKKRRR